MADQRPRVLHVSLSHCRPKRTSPPDVIALSTAVALASTLAHSARSLRPRIVVIRLNVRLACVILATKMSPSS